jgi:hypothetical protein
VPDRLPGVVVLKLCWAQIAERGAETASVEDLIDKARKIGGDILEGLINSSDAPGLDLQRFHEGFGVGGTSLCPRSNGDSNYNYCIRYEHPVLKIVSQKSKIARQVCAYSGDHGSSRARLGS